MRLRGKPMVMVRKPGTGEGRGGGVTANTARNNEGFGVAPEAFALCIGCEAETIPINPRGRLRQCLSRSWRP